MKSLKKLLFAGIRLAACPLVMAQTLASQFDHDLDFDLNVTDKITTTNGTLFMGARPLPPLHSRAPGNCSPTSRGLPSPPSLASATR